MAALKWTPEALRWLEDIHRYIARDNPRAAAKVIDGIVKKAELVANFSGIGTRMRVEPEGDVRMIMYGHYRIAYLCRLDVDVIEVLGVFHDALDIEKYFP